MIRILVNDGINELGKKKLVEAGLEVVTDNVPQEELASKISEYQAILVRSATKVTKENIDGSENLSLIGRGGVGLDNIDVAYAESKGIKVVNTPGASSASVAELVFSHLFGMVRFLHDSNRKMPAEGIENFKSLKKDYAKGVELQGKTLGIIGIGRIGQETARIALGIGMNVIAHDAVDQEVDIKLKNAAFDNISVKIKTISKEELLEKSDFISIHSPFKKGDEPILNANDFSRMRDGVGIINCARGGVIDETDLVAALNSGKVAYAGIDVYMQEPTDNQELLDHPKVSLTPHIGASTLEAQERIGIELAKKVIDHFKNSN